MKDYYSKMVKRGYLLGLLIITAGMLSVSFVSAWDFYGYAYDTNGNALSNTLVNITIWAMAGGPPTLVGSNSTNSSGTGWFNFSVSENPNWMYKPVITHTNSTTGALDYIGQSLPQFPYQEFVDTTDINFYLREAGTINMTAINASGNRITFRYQVKDVRLGYSIAEEFTTPTSEAIVYVPRDRNYSVMIYPEQAIPVSFNWNNFTSASSYNITPDLATYNVTTHTVQKTFNCTDNMIRLTGYIKNSTGSDFADWNEFAVVPFLLEPGNMIYLGENAGMPYNMSAWIEESDGYNQTSGFYNISLPGSAESATYILFATARNGSLYYGGYRNISLSYSDASTELNFTMYPLMSTDWSSANSNITLKNPTDSGSTNISSAKQQFNLVNSSEVFSNLNAHLEIKVDYTAYGSREFTFMTDISSGSASFYIPLLNFSVKEMNIFSQMYAPKTIGTKTALQILNNSNITMREFDPGDIDGGIGEAQIFIKLGQSNSTCDLPVPDDACWIGKFGPGESEARANFNPLSSIIGGGKLNFRMGYGNIEVVYINVDMIASGPPDAAFDDSVNEQTSGGFSASLRFGSSGPKIYDYAMISLPYTQGSSSTTGLNESADVNMSIPTFYDENWQPIWTSANGTNATALGANYSHYNERKDEWQYLMISKNCTSNVSQFNKTTPCYIDKTNNKIWIRLPHFSGTAPSITGNVITAVSTPTTQGDDSSGAGGGAEQSYWTMTYVANDLIFNSGAYSANLTTKQRAKFKINTTYYYIGVVGYSSSKVTINMSIANNNSVVPKQAVLDVGVVEKFDLTNDGFYDVQVTLVEIVGNRTNFLISPIQEKALIPETESETSQTGNQTGTGLGAEEGKATSIFKSRWFWIGLMIVLAAVIGIVYYLKAYRKQ